MGQNHKAGARLTAADGYPFRAEKRKDQYSRAVIYAVHGFWSGNSVSVIQSRDYRDGKWESPQINWSCGGRDPGKEPDEILAVKCFAEAITAAVKVARKWQKANRISQRRRAADSQITRSAIPPFAALNG